MRMRLTSWLTLVNDKGQGFPEAELMAVAGKLNVTSDYRALADPPQGRPLQLTCYPPGRTADGSPMPWTGPYPPPPQPSPPMAAPMAVSAGEAIMVTGSRISKAAVIAREEDLADLKLFRVPEPVTVEAQSQKQIAFLDTDGVKGALWHTTTCAPLSASIDPTPAALLLTTVNDAGHGLGMALPTGGMTVFESRAGGDLLVSEPRLRDYAAGKDVEIELGSSAQVFARCSVERDSEKPKPDSQVLMKLGLTNAKPSPSRVRITLGGSAALISGLRGVRVKDGARIFAMSLPANGRRELRWMIVED